MSKEGFNWKSLFVKEEETPENSKQTIPTPPTIPSNKFPESLEKSHSFPSNFNDNPFLNEILEVYNNGFESLNQNGFDFFEMYKSVMAVGPTNAQSYQMAFTMGKTINKDLTKSFLLDKASYYISEIEKVYTKYEEVGNTKNKELSNSVMTNKYNLSKSIKDIENQILRLKEELEAKTNELNKIDLDNREQFSEIQLKLDANKIAKQKILDSINTVITGINQYL